MELKINNGRRKTFAIEYVEVTAENLAAVAEWSGGVVKEHEGTSYVDIVDKNAINSRQTKAFDGDYVVHHLELKTFKSFSKKAFSKAFEGLDDANSNITHHEVPRDATSGEFVTKAYADANPDTTVVEEIDIAHVQVTQKGTGHTATVPADEVAPDGVDPKSLGQSDLPHDADPS